MHDLERDVYEMFDALGGCLRGKPKEFGILYNFHDPHPAADAFIREHDRATAVDRAKGMLQGPKASAREILRLRAVIYNHNNRDAINAKQRLRHAKKRSA